MRDFLSLSLPIGRWVGVQIRVHFLLILFAVFTIWYCAQDPNENFLGYGLVLICTVCLSVAVHEIGHCWAAWRVGGVVEQVVIWPFGGLAAANVPHFPHPEFWSAVAGPIASLGCCLLAAIPIVVMEGIPWELLHPMNPPTFAEGVTVLAVLRVVFWTNWMLVVVNMLPAFPMDGGRILRAFLWPRTGYKNAVAYVSRGAVVMSLLMCLYAWWAYDTYPYATLPLLVFASFLFFVGVIEGGRLMDRESHENLEGFDLSQMIDGEFDRSHEPTPGPIGRWMARRKEAWIQRQKEMEEQEERQMDEILARVHVAGIESLSMEERLLLNRVSSRYRNRLHR